MKQVRNVYHFVVSGFGMELIGLSGLGFINALYFRSFIANKTVNMEMVQLQWNFASAKEILHIFTLLY
jgi:hypothetical protein